MSIREMLALKTEELKATIVPMEVTGEMTVRECYEHWAQVKREEKKLRPDSKLRLDDEFERYLQVFADRRICTVTREEVSEYFIRRILQENLEEEDWRAIQQIIYYVFDHGQSLGLVDFDYYDISIDVEDVCEFL